MSTAIASDKKTEASQLDQLRKFTKVVADTADFESIKDFKPADATTNPSLVYAATQKEQYGHLLDEVLNSRKKSGFTGQEQIERLRSSARQFGSDILEIVPGRVRRARGYHMTSKVRSTGRQLIQLYEERKIPASGY
jgi:transaldolase